MKRTFLILLLFAVLALLANATPYFPLDLAISRTVQSIHSPAFDLLMKAVSSVGGGRVFPFAAVFFTGLILFLNLRLEALYLSISPVLSLLAGSLTKLLVFRPRPADGLVSIYKNLSDRSFPSSHTLVYTVIFGFLFFIALTRLPSSPMRFLLLFLSAFLVATIGLSRVYLGAHWASDVIGGYLAGIAFLSLTINTYKAHAQR